MAPANGIEAFRATSEQARGSPFHKISLMYPQRHVNAFVGWYGVHEPGAIDQPETSAIELVGVVGERSMRRGAIS